MPADSFSSSSSSSSSSSLTAATFSVDDSSSSSSSMAASSFDWKYDVFLSFRGEDTRNNFTGHLYKALDQKGIDTFIDDKKLRRGEEISPTLITAIRRSRCSIIVLSENYASSKWCLEELVEILVCKRTKNQSVMPIFYNVDPSHVRNQTGNFGKAMAKHDKNKKIMKKKVQKWREALNEVGKLSGIHYPSRSEVQVIEEIIVDVCKDLNRFPSKDTQLLVGFYSYIKELELLLCLDSIDVRMVGIWGMGGIGKTTLAKAIYERISHKFEGSCFLADVGLDLARKGEDYLKQLLLSGILKDKNIDATTTSLKAKLKSKKVLIVIDNVNHRSILKTLVGKGDWFGAKSRIIITTRDKQFLTMHGVNVVYEVQILQDGQDIEVFNYYAFRDDSPSRDFMNLIDHVIAYAQGLPLALEVLGSSLCKKSKDEWICVLNKLKKIPNREIHEALQKSFDELDDDEKNIFLDIAFTFVGEEKDVVVEILDSCGFSATIGITTLVDKSLIRIIDGKLHIHDLLIEMGSEIVRRPFPKEPGKRSRLCIQQDICHVLEKHTGTEDIEIMNFCLSGLEEIRFTTTAFAKMTKLRVLSIYGESSPSKVLISDDFKLHCGELRLLLWKQYPLKSLPYDFEPKNLLWLIIEDSHLTQLWKGNKVFEKLKYIRLYGCKYLRETPNFSRVTNLYLFSCEGCTELYKIHSSLGYLKKLTKLSFEDCTNLKHIPGIGKLESLEKLILSGCSKLKKFPDISQPMPWLSELYLDGTAIIELPSSICYAIKLTLLSLRNCINLERFPSIDGLVFLEKLILSGCSKLEKFMDISQPMPCLSELYLDETAITELPSSIAFATQLVRLVLRECKNLLSLPSSICELTHLEILSLPGCSNLGKCKEANSRNRDALPRTLDRLCSLRRLELQNCSSLSALPALPSSLELVNASNCPSLKDISTLSVLSLGGFIFEKCIELRKHPNRMKRDLLSIATHIADKKRWMSTHDQEKIFTVPFSTVFPANGIPNWFKHCRKGHTIGIEASPNWNSNDFLGFAVSAVMKIGDSSSTYCNLDWYDHNSESGPSRIYFFIDDHTRELQFTEDEHLWLAYIPSVFSLDAEEWSGVDFTFHTDNEISSVKCCGICPMYTNSRSSDEYDSDVNYFSSDDSDGGNPGGSSVDDLSSDEYDSDVGNPGGSFLYDLLQYITMRRSPEKAPSRGSVQEDVKMGTVFWVLITIFGFLFLAHILLWAPNRLPTIWVSPLGADPLGISRLFAALLPSHFGVPTLLGVVVLLPYFPAELTSVSQFQWRRYSPWLHHPPLQRPAPPRNQLIYR